MARHPGKQGTRLFPLEMAFRQPARRLEGFETKFKINPRVFGRYRQRAEEIFDDLLPVIDEGRH
jgi:hypothetical protein